LHFISFFFVGGLAGAVPGPQGQPADRAEAHHLQRVVQRAQPQQHEHAARHVQLRSGTKKSFRQKTVLDKKNCFRQKTVLDKKAVHTKIDLKCVVCVIYSDKQRH
jgi:hypothetical protein